MIAFLDLETRSLRSVKDRGVDAMVEGDGMILSAHYAVDDAPVANWRGAFYDDPDPTPLLDAIENGAMVCAHNARFDRRVWNAWRKPHWPMIRVEKTVDSATMCRLVNWPAALGKAAARLGGEKLPNVTYRKLWDMRHPMGETDRPLFDQMVGYGDQDVVEMRRLFNTLPKLSPELQQEWIASERVNDRGFLVDLDWAKDAATLFKSCTLDSGDQVRVLTRGLVPTVKSSAALLAWLELHVGRRLTRPVKVRIGGGRAGFRTVVKATADKSARASLREWLLTSDEAPTRATPAVLEVMDAIDDAAGAAGSKYQAALDRCSGDGRLRGSYIMHGASQTGRFTAGGMQPHNLIRHKSKDPILERNECIAAPSTAAIGKLLRSTVIAPPGRKLVWCDWSAIEARITPWLAIGPDTPAAERASAEAVLKIFFDGGDVYLHAASGIYGRPIGKKDIERQHGKVACIAAGTRVVVRTSTGAITTKAVQDVSACDMVWDGIEWVRQDGPVHNGDKRCITLNGTKLTRDHMIWCGNALGWRAAGAVASSGFMSRQASASGQASLSSLDSFCGPAVQSAHSLCNATAGARNTGLTNTRSRMGARCAAMPAGKSKLARRGVPTTGTSGRSTPCPCASSRSKRRLPVYDLLNAGPRNRFTILTPTGAMVVHNCLALGFGGSVGALANMARAYATELPDPAGIVKGYREANPWILWLCRKVEEAAFEAVRNHGQVFGAGKLQLVASHATLALVLPDGSALHYPNPRIEMVDRFGKDDGEEQPTVTFDHPAFGRAALSGPVCTENPTQAVAARILRRALVLHERQHQADPRVGPIVMHTHDEMVAECDEADLELTYAALERSMSTFEPWADGLPMAAEAGYGRFYQTEEKSDD